MTNEMLGWCRGLCLLLLWCWTPWAAAQDFAFVAPATPADPGAPAVMRDLAERLLPVYMEKDSERYLGNLAALQLVAGDYKAAYKTRQSLRERRPADAPTDRTLIYDLYARARAIEAVEKLGFSQAFAQAYREILPRLGDRDAHAVQRWLETPRSIYEGALQKSFDRWRGRSSIPAAEAVELIWAYLSFDAYRNFSPLVKALDREESGRRYVYDAEAVIDGVGGSRIHVLVVRPAAASAALPALLEFGLAASQAEAEACAAHGYVGVVAYTRGGRGEKPGQVDPFRRDGDNARALIRWITRQPWSDGRVGMYGERYSGFTAWAAAKRLPAALKAIATANPIAPGIDFPKTGQIFHNDAYRWALQRSGVPQDEDAPWSAIDLAWYRSGRPYPELGRGRARPSPMFQRWLIHPSYDRYWQKMVPFGAEFARIDIPVLTLGGYYAEGAVGALHYFSQHLRQRPEARHTLLIGPYAEGLGHASPAAELRGYALDAAALIDPRELRFRWFDSIFISGASRPSLLRDRVNYQLMGSNEWRHAPSLEAISNGALRFHLAGAASGGPHRLLEVRPARDRYVLQTLRFSERRDAQIPPSPAVVDRDLPLRNGLSFVSEPLQQAVEFGGLLRGELDFRPSAMDLDLSLTVYEQLASGAYVMLSQPYEFRASYAADPVNRRLLQAGVRQRLAFTSQRPGGRRLAAGSRVVLVLAVNKRPDRQINYGSGKAVNEEDISDASRALRIRWYSGSFIELPVRIAVPPP